MSAISLHCLASAANNIHVWDSRRSRSVVSVGLNQFLISRRGRVRNQKQEKMTTPAKTIEILASDWNCFRKQLRVSDINFILSVWYDSSSVDFFFRNDQKAFLRITNDAEKMVAYRLRASRPAFYRMPNSDGFLEPGKLVLHFFLLG